MRHVQQYLGERRHLPRAIRRFHHPRLVEAVQHALCEHDGIIPDSVHVCFRRAAAHPEFRLTIAMVLLARDHVRQVVAIRAGEVQHQVADGIRAIVRAPPELVFCKMGKARRNLGRIIVHESHARNVQNRGFQRSFHRRMIFWLQASGYSLPAPGQGVTFQPSDFHPLFEGGHKQTLYAWGKPRYFPRLPTPVIRYFDVTEDVRVLAHCHWQKNPWAHPTFILLHGLEGSSLAHYMVGISDKAWTAGWNVVRLNQRNCGDTEHLSQGLYHSGLTHDPMFVMRELIEVDRISSIVVAGYSLGGNLALKLAGELGDTPTPELKAICAVSPTMDLACCIEALERRSNWIYEWNFVRNLKKRMRRKAEAWPGAFNLTPLSGVRTVRQFDEAFTAPHHGFRDAADYYFRASAIRVIDRIRVPTLIITSEDDPFVPSERFRDPLITANPHLTIVIAKYGGHCAFVERSTPDYDGYWAEREVVRFATTHVAGRPKDRLRPITAESV
jgi:predicted alpha/beta-fold hydrolase